MLEGQEDIQQDVSSGESSEAPQTSTPETSQVPAEASTQETQPVQERKPFNEDPQIQDFIQRQVAKQTQRYEQQLAEFQRRFEQSSKPAEQPKRHKFVEKLAEIDPEYASYIEGLEQRAAKAEQLEKRFGQMDQQQVVKEYESAVERMHAENKVPEELKARIKRELDFRAMTNPNLGLRDLPNVYKEVLEDHTKWIDSIKRAERSSYVADKSKDARAPSTQPKGAPAVRKEQATPAKDIEDVYSRVVKRVMDTRKAGSEI